MSIRSERAAAKKRAADYNKKLLAEHASLRAQILALRPTWSAEKLEEIRQTWNGCMDDSLGLGDILMQIKAADALDARFALPKDVK